METSMTGFYRRLFESSKLNQITDEMFAVLTLVSIVAFLVLLYWGTPV